MQNVVADCLSRTHVALYAGEPDHLASSKSMYCPIFALTFVINILEHIRRDRRKTV